MGICVKDENIKYLKSRKIILENERKSLMLNNDGSYVSELKNEDDRDYFNKLVETIEKINEFLEDEKEYIQSKLMNDIINVDKLLNDYLAINENDVFYDEDNLINVIIPYLKGKLTIFNRERDNLIDPDFNKVYFDRNGIYSIGLKCDSDIELFQKLEEIISKINKFLLLNNELIRREMYVTMNIVNDVINSEKKNRF